jgi:hypothetical protein
VWSVPSVHGDRLIEIGIVLKIAKRRQAEKATNDKKRQSFYSFAVPRPKSVRRAQRAVTNGEEV